jgi:predicted RNase H-like nuclease (RuvC/YqgF family)
MNALKIKLKSNIATLANELDAQQEVLSELFRYDRLVKQLRENVETYRMQNEDLKALNNKLQHENNELHAHVKCLALKPEFR